MPRLIGSCPHFYVSDIHAALDHYCDVLGFRRPRIWGEPPCFAMPDRDGFIVMLSHSDEHPPAPNGAHAAWDAYFWCTGVDALHEEFVARGANIAYEPTDQESYGIREMAVRDLDGHLLAFGEELESARG